MTNDAALPQEGRGVEPTRVLDATTITMLIVSIGLSTAGQLLLKSGMDVIGELGFADIGLLIRSVLSTWQVILGLTAFGASAVFWLLTLSRVPLSTAYPIVSLGYVLILLFSVLVLGERPSLTVWGGVALIMGGISLIGIGQS